MKKKILVIDDDYPIRLLVKKVLEPKYEITIFSDVAKVFEDMNTSGLPDIIICDINLPVINGKDFLNNIKSSPIYGHIPIIIMSSWINNEIKSACEKATAFIEKPFNPDKLSRTIEEVLSNVNNSKPLAN